jgi:hypothetical protein
LDELLSATRRASRIDYDTPDTQAVVVHLIKSVSRKFAHDPVPLRICASENQGIIIVNSLLSGMRISAPLSPRSN